MANNDKLKQLISNLQNLTDLAVGMKDSDLYPVSFFSKVFDLIQKIQKGFHTLEADQVEMFASQMKKHQDLITSIHRQMRNIENIPESGTSFEAPKPVTLPEQPAEPVKEYITPQKADAGVVESDSIKVEKPPKAPIFNQIIDRETVSAPDISHQLLLLNDAVKKNKLSDLRKAFSLNDRFLYQRKLFEGRQDVMDKVISDINSHRSLKESLSYLEEKLHWDFSDPTVNDFIKKLEIRFL
jgi:hypothetical protein